MCVLPEPYEFDDDGLFLEEQKISNYIIVPQKVYHLPDETTPFCYSIGVLTAGQGETPLGAHVLPSELTQRWWKTPPPGCWTDPKAQHADSHLRVVFNALLQELEPQELVCVDTLGWQKLPGGNHVYVAGTDEIGACGETNLWVPRDLESFRIELPSTTSPEAALQYFWRLCDLKPGISDVLLATTLSSFLMPMFKSAGIHTWFSVMLEGPTESKKTTLATLTSGLYARISAPRSCVLSLTSTHSALERRLGQLRHCTVICDDLFPDGGTAQQKLVRDLIRDQANQTPREIVNGSSITTYPRESGLVFTVEKAPLSCQSTNSRCLRLVLDGPISNDQIATVQTDSALLGNVWYLFLEQTAARYEELEQFVAEEFADYRKNRLNETGPERLPEIEAILYIAMACFLKLFPAADSQKRLKQLTVHLNHWVEISGSQKSLFQAIQDIHDRAPNYFCDRWDCWCIPRTDLTVLLRKSLGDYTLSERTVTAMLYQRHALQTDKSGERTKKIHGQRCLCIIPEQLIDLS